MEIHLKKNDEIELNITDISNTGEGIGHYEGMTFFVSGAIPGDTIRAGITKLKKTYGYARLIEILEASPDRVEPVCPVALRCGGCQIMQMDYRAQLRWKEQSVRSKLHRIGGFSDEVLDRVMQPIIGMEEGGGFREAGAGFVPCFFRNKAQYPVGRDAVGDTVMGFYAGHSHRIISTDKCYLGTPINEAIRDVITGCDEVVPYDETSHTGLLRHVMIRRSEHYPDVMVVLVVNSSQMTRDVREMADVLLPELLGIGDVAEASYQSDEAKRVTSVVVSFNDKPGNVIMGDRCETVYGEGYIRDRIGDVEYHISALSFYQVNPTQTKKLYDKVLEYADLTGSEVVWDLYCGIGTISLYMARHAAAVYGVEVIPDAIRDAKENAALNGIENARFFVGKAEVVLPEFYSRSDVDISDAKHPDVIVVDPPRKGCNESCLSTILEMQPDRIVYVSCDHATLARDLKYLCTSDKASYTLTAVTPLDQFCHSVHVETVCLLSKLSGAKHHVNIKLDMDEMDLTAAESKATYDEIREWVQEKYGFHVTNLNIAQVKREHGIIERENYNKPRSEDSRQPGCPKEKVKAIGEALRFFQMI